MKAKNLFYSMLSVAVIGLSATACSSDSDNDLNDTGSKIELPQNRVFILNEGAYDANNAGITLYDPSGKMSLIADIYSTQNGLRLGDTGQDIIEYDENLYVILSGSQYITKLNSAGVEQARYSFTEEQGSPRFMVAEDGKIYVTLYSGNVARLNAVDLKFEGMVKVGNNPEQIIELDDKLYCVNSGWGTDNRLSIIDTRNFTEVQHVDIFTNPEQIIEVDGTIIIQGFGGAYPNYTYPVAVYDKTSKTYREIGKGSRIAGYDHKAYVIYSETDWSTYTTVNTFYTYDVRSGEVNSESFLKNVPAELVSGSICMLSINDENGDIYIGTSDYVTNGDVYRFSKDGALIESFESGGISPRKAVYVD